MEIPIVAKISQEEIEVKTATDPAMTLRINPVATVKASMIIMFLRSRE